MRRASSIGDSCAINTENSNLPSARANALGDPARRVAGDDRVTLGHDRFVSEFIPPYPPRFAEEPSTWQRIMAARKNLLGMWAEGAFDYDFVGTRVLAQHVFVCNTPETVQYAFNTHN